MELCVRAFFRIFFRGTILSRIFFLIFFRGFSSKYSFSDLISNMVVLDHKKTQLTGVLSDGTVTHGFTKSNESLNTLLYFLSKEVFSQIFFVDFLSNILSRVLFRILFRVFSFKYYFAYFLSNILSLFSFEYSSLIFFQIWLHGTI